MKKVNAKWLPTNNEEPKDTENLQQVEYPSFRDMLDEEFYIGFEPKYLNEHYIVVTQGAAKGLAIKPNSTYTFEKDEQKYALGTYFIFEDERELFEWILET